MNTMRKNLILTTLLTAILLLTVATPILHGGEIPDAELRQEIKDILAQKIPDWQPGLKAKLISQKTVERLGIFHLSPKQMDSELSSRWYEDILTTISKRECL